MSRNERARTGIATCAAPQKRTSRVRGRIRGQSEALSAPFRYGVNSTSIRSDSLSGMHSASSLPLDGLRSWSQSASTASRAVRDSGSMPDALLKYFMSFKSAPQLRTLAQTPRSPLRRATPRIGRDRRLRARVGRWGREGQACQTGIPATGRSRDRPAHRALLVSRFLRRRPEHRAHGIMRSCCG